MHTGIRIGELCGLKGGDFNFTNETFEIHRTISRIRNTESTPDHQDAKTKVIIGTPKSTSSLRTIPVPRQLLSLLKRQHLSPDEYLMTGTAHYTEPRNIQRRFRNILKKCKSSAGDLSFFTPQFCNQMYRKRCRQQSTFRDSGTFICKNHSGYLCPQ